MTETAQANKKKETFDKGIRKKGCQEGAKTGKSAQK